MDGLEVVVTGIKLSHPIMNASGVLASTPEGVARLIDAGVSAVVTKTLTKEPREGYKTPITIPLPIGLLNAVGLANPGIEAVGKLVETGHSLGKPVIVSIGGRDPEEFLYLAEKALEAGADALELNLSCPHTPGYGVDAAKTIKTIKEVVKNTASISNKPVWAKLGYSRLLVKEAGAALEAGASALVLINTIPGMKIDVYALKPILSHGYGGLSGPAIHPIAVYSIYTVYREYKPEIIGAGGAVDWESAIELLAAGAKAVQIATAFHLKGYNIIKEIINGIKQYLKQTKRKNITEIIGSATK